jgi:hypothetical protein
MFSKKFQITPHFYPICFGKCCPAFTYIGGPKVGTAYFKIEPSTLESPIVSFILSDQSNRLCKKRKMNLGGTLSDYRRGE